MIRRSTRLCVTQRTMPDTFMVEVTELDLTWLSLTKKVNDMNCSIGLLKLLEMFVEGRLRSVGRPGDCDLLATWNQVGGLLPEHWNRSTHLSIRKHCSCWTPESGFSFDKVSYVPVIIDTSRIEVSSSSAARQSRYESHK